MLGRWDSNINNIGWVLEENAESMKLSQINSYSYSFNIADPTLDVYNAYNKMSFDRRSEETVPQ